MPHAYHAFTLEMPALTMRQLEEFFERLELATWQGDGSVWIAAEDTEAEIPWLACDGDWMRAVRPVESVALPKQARSRKAASRNLTS